MPGDDRHTVNVDVNGESPFGEPETMLFRWTRPMDKADLVALAATYSAVITMDDEAPAEASRCHAALPRHARDLRGASTWSTSPCAPTAGGPPSADPRESPV